MYRSDLVDDIEVNILHETEAAYLVTDGKIEVWVPKSKVEIETTGIAGIVKLTMPEWLAVEKGFV